MWFLCGIIRMDAERASGPSHYDVRQRTSSALRILAKADSARSTLARAVTLKAKWQQQRCCLTTIAFSGQDYVFADAADYPWFQHDAT